MTIANEITQSQTNLANSYTACQNKGATMPASQNFDNLATCIASISSGGTVSDIIREVSNQGVYQMPSSNFTFSLPSNATDVGNYALSNAFRGCATLTNVDLSSLSTVSGVLALNYAFNGCNSLTSVDLSALATVSSSNGLNSAFSGCTSLTSMDLSALTTISGTNGLSNIFEGCSGLTSVDLSALATVSGGYGLYNAFNNCIALSNISFPSLATISGSNEMSWAFRGCTSLISISFPALTTTSFGSNINQFDNMMYATGSTATHTIHFPSNLESTIQGLTGYPLFGGTSGYVVLAFDLPATDISNGSAYVDDGGDSEQF